MTSNVGTQSPDDFSKSLLWKLSNDPSWFLCDALDQAEPLGRRLKPWEELNERQRAIVVRHVKDMSLWRAESKVDPNDADERFRSYPELRELLA